MLRRGSLRVKRRFPRSTGRFISALLSGNEQQKRGLRDIDTGDDQADDHRQEMADEERRGGGERGDGQEREADAADHVCERSLPGLTGCEGLAPGGVVAAGEPRDGENEQPQPEEADQPGQYGANDDRRTASATRGSALISHPRPTRAIPAMSGT
jgi:hypothetical protein